MMQIRFIGITYICCGRADDCVNLLYMRVSYGYITVDEFLAILTYSQ